MKNKFLFYLILLALIPSLGYTQGKTSLPVVRFGIDPTWPPMEFIDDQRNLVGFDIDLVNSLAKLGKFEPQFVTIPWDGIFEALSSGKVDAIISSVSITPERQGRFLFSEPYINAGQVILVPISEQGTLGLNDLSGRVVGVQSGTSAEALVKEFSGTEIKTYDDLNLAVMDMLGVRIGAIVLDLAMAADMTQRNPNTMFKVRIASKPLNQDEFGIVFLPSSKSMVKMINLGLKKIKTDGTMDELMNKWGLNYP